MRLQMFVLTESKLLSFLFHMPANLFSQSNVCCGAIYRAPLSEGSVEDDGSLLCSYHGWRWGGDGNLSVVPHFENESELQRIIHNPKSSCNAFPTKVKGGLLYVWPASGSDA